METKRYVNVGPKEWIEMCNRKWQGFSNEEIHEAFCHAEYQTDSNWQDDPERWCKAFARYLESILRDKNYVK
jgi:hypothetical protein